ncbi:MAG: metallophosphoesterase family protein [Balneolales bacterium]|nr:metallophosphoesterase family protein [Balneolales bacterium]
MLFVSDVHLGGFDSDTNAALERDFIALMKWCQQNQTQVILLGDVFDYYMQYGKYTPEVSHTILHWFKHYHQSGNPSTLYITGNHDNWDFGALDEAGFDTEHEYRLFRTENECILMLMHGDGLYEPKFGFPRPLFHRFLRNPYFVKMFKALTTGKAGNSIMRRFSAWSRKNDRADKSDKVHLDSNVVRMLHEFELDVIICGHHHEVRDITAGQKRYMNTGAFYIDRSACLYTKGLFHLVKWDGLNHILHKPN